VKDDAVQMLSNKWKFDSDILCYCLLMLLLADAAAAVVVQK
jgi:hypothetical protein